MAKKSPEDQNEIPFLEKFMVSQTYDIFRFGGEEIKNDEVGIQRMLQNFSGLLTEEQIRENMKKYNLPKMFELVKEYFKKEYDFEGNIQYSDLYSVVLVLCATGLIFIPEVVYVRDIYEKTAPRANTMFKLTYQAYILFALMMSYILVCFVTGRIRYLKENSLSGERRRMKKTIFVQILAGFSAILLLISTCGYLCNAIDHWFDGFPRKSAYQTLNATGYLENSIPDDAAAIRWLNKNVKGQPIVLEACGDSYKDYDNRVSAMTGLPTVLGWYVHEWLWRNNLEEENQRKADVETIYTSTDKNKIQELIKKYHIGYLFIGTCEYEKYGKINTDLLDSLGQIVFIKEKTRIIKV